MVQKQRKIRPAIKRALYEEAGGKCANPGCSNWRSHIHHIKHWAIYKCHNADDMIAVCPSCHDAIHHGDLHITDDVLYLWKGIDRISDLTNTAHIYVEPATHLKLLTGTIALSTNNDRVAVFELSNTNRLTLRVLDGDILQVTSRLQDLEGKEVLRVIENHVRVARDHNVKFEFHAGHARVTIPASENYIPSWVIQQMRVQDATFAADGRVVALDIEVLKPGLVKVEGFWPADEGSVVITQNSLSFCHPSLSRPLSLVGDGENSVLMYAGPINSKLFGFG